MYILCTLYFHLKGYRAADLWSFPSGIWKQRKHLADPYANAEIFRWSIGFAHSSGKFPFQLRYKQGANVSASFTFISKHCVRVDAANTWGFCRVSFQRRASHGTTTALSGRFGSLSSQRSPPSRRVVTVVSVDLGPELVETEMPASTSPL